MSEWITELINSLGFQISTVIIIFGALCLYFGRIIVFPKIFKVEKIDTYSQGLIFLITFIFLPFVFTIFVIWLILFINTMIFAILLLIPISIIIYDLFFVIRIHKIKDKISFINYIRKQNESSKKKPLILQIIPLEILSWATIVLSGFFAISAYYNSKYQGFAELAMIAISFFIAFTMLTIISMFYGYSIMHYPKSIVEYEIGNGSNKITKIDGVILESGEFFTIISDEIIHHIKRDRIIHIKEVNKDNAIRKNHNKK